ncbi:MAG TPA: MFS transporter [Nocardioidaceae bacterium]|nr:MFS transporter [Nocardioidaceae bacterium]
MALLGRYRTILEIPGAWRFSAAGFVARLPISMFGLGIVLLVADRTGSYGLAGTVAAAEVVAGAAVSPFSARLSDRFGQARVLPLLALGFCFATGLLILAVESDQPTPLPHAAALLAGATMPHIGSNVRARWRYVIDDRRQLDTAFALEAVVDEMIFVVGPVLVTVLATQVNPGVALATTAGLCLVGSTWLASQHATQPVVGGDEHGQRVREPLGWRLLAPLMIVMVGLGGLFGGSEVVSVAFAEAEGSTAAAGWLLASMAAGSLIAGLVTGAVTLRQRPAVRVRWGTTALTASVAPLPFLPSLGLVAAMLFLAGLAIAPTLVAAVSMVEQTVPPARLTEGIAWVTAGIISGVAPGSALAGAVVDATSASTAYGVLFGFGVLAMVAAWLTLPRGRSGSAG